MTRSPSLIYHLGCTQLLLLLLPLFSVADVHDNDYWNEEYDPRLELNTACDFERIPLDLRERYGRGGLKGTRLLFEKMKSRGVPFILVRKGVEEEPSPLRARCAEEEEEVGSCLHASTDEENSENHFFSSTPIANDFEANKEAADLAPPSTFQGQSPPSSLFNPPSPPLGLDAKKWLHPEAIANIIHGMIEGHQSGANPVNDDRLRKLEIFFGALTSFLEEDGSGGGSRTKGADLVGDHLGEYDEETLWRKCPDTDGLFQHYFVVSDKTRKEEYVAPCPGLDGHNIPGKAPKPLIPLLEELFRDYQTIPLCRIGVEGYHLNFGFSPSGSGLNFHKHQAAFSEVLQGKKRYFFLPPDGMQEISEITFAYRRRKKMSNQEEGEREEVALARRDLTLRETTPSSSPIAGKDSKEEKYNQEATNLWSPKEWVTEIVPEIALVEAERRAQQLRSRRSSSSQLHLEEGQEDSSTGRSRRRLMYQCTLEPGEIMYIPSGWWHMTLNLGTSLYMSSFINRMD